MLFTSVEFLIFFPVVLTGYFLLPQRARWPWILIASCVFYMAFKPEYILICAAAILTDYVCGLLIAKAQRRGVKKLFVAVAVAVALGLLFFYKYLNFSLYSVQYIVNLFGVGWSAPSFDIVLPIGLSFMTFQSLGYVVDVYRGDIPPEKNFGIFATFVMFFPQLVAGPIERAGNLLGQFRVKHRFSAANLAEGLRWMLWGYFKKMVIADQLSVLVDLVYKNVEKWTGPAFVVATVAFAFQIYCDFSGYSDIARGVAKCMGFDLMVNFKKPYFSRSTGEFWRRWHISLSSYFRDYVYIPLGGSRKGLLRTCVNNEVTMLLSGLWHGASWTYVVWGGLNGLYIVVGRLTKKLRERIARVTRFDRLGWFATAVRVAVTFTLVLASWVFFRAQSFSDALYVFTHLAPDFSLPLLGLGGLELSKYAVLVGIPILIMFVCHFTDERGGALKKAFYSHRALRFACYIALVAMILGLGVSEVEAPFVYFQF